MDSVTGERPAFYTSAEAVARLNVPPLLFRWVVKTEKIALPMFGNRAVYTDETLAAIKAVFDAKDPSGKFIVRESRKNGPRRKKLGTVAKK